MLQTDKDNYAATSSVTSTAVAQYKEYCLQLTESQVENLIEFFEFQFIPMIRNDEGIDNINYIADMMQIFTKLRICEQEIEEFKNQINCEKTSVDDGCATTAVYRGTEVVGGFINDRGQL